MMRKKSICLVVLSSLFFEASAIQRQTSILPRRHDTTPLILCGGGISGKVTTRTPTTPPTKENANDSSPPPPSSPSLIPLLSSTVLLMISLSIVSLSPTPILIDTYGASRATHILSTLAALAAASEIILSPILGAALDSMGRKPAMIGSVLSVAVVHAVASVNTDAVPICIARYLCYVSLPQFFVASQAIAGDMMGSMPDKLGSFLGIQSALISAGFIGGVTIAGRLSEQGPEAAYGLSSVLAVVSGAILVFGLKETLDDEHKVAFDVQETKRKVIQAPVAAGHLLVGRGAKVGALALLLLLQSMPMFMGDVIQVFAREQWNLGPNGLASLIAIFGATGIVSSLVGSVLIKKMGMKNFTGFAILSSLCFPLAAMVSYKAALVAAVVGFLGSAQTIGVSAELTSQVTAMGARQGELAGERASLLALTKVLCPIIYGGLYVIGSKMGAPQLLFGFNALLALFSFVLSRGDLW